MGRPNGPQLVSLRVRNLRNLRSIDLGLGAGPRRILLTGPNGSGKTTLLEAVYLLARGRSFRGRKAGSLTTDGEHRTLIEGRFREVGSPNESTLVFERSGRGSLRQLDGVALSSLAPRESPLRVKLVGENPQALLEGEPTLRRGLLDWNVFHVEHQFGQLRVELRRVLAQRNAALRSGSAGVSLWDPAFLELSDRITAKRSAFFDLWRAHLLRLSSDFPFLDGCDLLFERGWPMDHDLLDVLEQGRTAEIQRGQTLAGPHRSDLMITRDGDPARLSRGQAKVVVCLLQLAAERVHRAAGLAPSLWLLDDLAAELDSATAKRVWGLFDGLDAQRFVTRLIPEPAGIADQDAMFHVEHGNASTIGVCRFGSG